MNIRVFAIATALTGLIALPAPAAPVHADTAGDCPTTLLHSAIRATDTITGWGQLHQLYQQYKPCDAGAVKANFTYNISTLLLEHWNSLPDLAKLTYHDADFGPFLAAHINGQLSPEQDSRLTDLARNNCPPGAGQLCTRILASLYNNEVVRKRFRMAN